MENFTSPLVQIFNGKIELFDSDDSTDSTVTIRMTVKMAQDLLEKLEENLAMLKAKEEVIAKRKGEK